MVAAGANADLVFLAANALEDIRSVRRIRAGVRGGRLRDRAALDTLLAQALQRRIK